MRIHVRTGICDNFIHSFREIFYLNILATINRQFSKAYQMYYAIIDNYNFFFFWKQEILWRLMEIETICF